MHRMAEDTKSASSIPTLEDWQHWTLVMGRAQQMMMEFWAEQMKQGQPTPSFSWGPSALGFAEPETATDPMALMSAGAQAWAKGLETWGKMLGGVGAPPAAEKKDRRFVEQRARDQQALFHAIGKGAHGIFRAVTQAYQVQHLIDAALRQIVQPAVEAQIIARGQALVYILFLCHYPDALFQLLVIAHYIAACHGSASAAGYDLTGQHADSGRFPGSIWSQQTKDLAAPHAKADTAHSFIVFERAPQIAGLNHQFTVRHSGSSFPVLYGERLFLMSICHSLSSGGSLAATVSWMLCSCYKKWLSGVRGGSAGAESRLNGPKTG